MTYEISCMRTSRIKRKIESIREKSKVSWLFFIPLMLSIIGLFFIFEASSIRSYMDVGDSFHYLKLQAVRIVLGVIVLLFFSMLDYHKLYYLSFIFMITTIMLLVFVLIPNIGRQAGGAQRWIDLGLFDLQPTEVAKFATIIYLSSWFNHRERKRFFSFFILLSILMFLIMLQPDMGTAIIIFSLSIIIYFLAGIELHYLLYLIPVSVGGFFILVKTSPYRFRRIMAFFNPALDPLGITYHINQILISLTHGGILGRGFGASRQKYLFLPEAHTDSIFAIIGEEVGFVGSIILIATFILFLYYLYRVSVHASDRFGRLLSGGIFAFFGLQIIINLSAMVNLMPLTGVPLPFFSYGGSHILTSFMLIGIVINIAKQSKTY